MAALDELKPLGNFFKKKDENKTVVLLLTFSKRIIMWWIVRGVCLCLLPVEIGTKAGGGITVRSVSVDVKQSSIGTWEGKKRREEKNSARC